MKLSHKTLVIISGMVWLAIGTYLLYIGLNLLANNTVHVDPHNYPLLLSLKPYAGTIENAALVLVVLGLAIGYYKGRYVLGKSAHGGVARIMAMPNPAQLSKIYSPKYYVLIAAMIGLGLSIKYLGVNNDIRGLVDVIIGSALINGALIYFRLSGKTVNSAAETK